MDKRWDQLADILVNWSVAVKEGERVIIVMREVETYPLVVAVYRAVVQARGFPQVQFLSERLRHNLLKYGTEEHIEWLPELERYSMEWADVYIDLRGAFNLHELSDIPMDVRTRNQRAMGRVSNLRWKHTRWTLVRVPSELFAQQGKIDYETMMDMFFDACLRDWGEEAKKLQRIADVLQQGEQIRILGRKTDLSFSVKGRTWLVGDARISVPDGEIYTAPVEDTIDGTIYFEFPGVLGGVTMEDIQLTWEKGKLVEATSSTNQDYLRSIVHTDAGSSLIGEFSFGTNDAVNVFTTDILIDEKIGGTIHTALGRPYKECGGTYDSAIHWDIVKDTRTESQVLLDGKCIFENGKFLI